MAEGSLSTIVLLAALAIIPLLLIVGTSFAKLAVVFSLLRNALGVPDVPSGAVITALAALLSVYVMSPVASEAATRTAGMSARIDFDRPLTGDSRVALGEALDAGLQPLREFFRRNAGKAELALFVELAQRTRPGQPAPVIGPNDLVVLLPAFLITELGEAFQVGLLVLLPFVILDIVVSSILLSLGMTALQPSAIALPFKLLLFVLVDGFTVLSRALISGYQ